MYKDIISTSIINLDLHLAVNIKKYTDEEAKQIIEKLKRIIHDAENETNTQ